MLRILKTNFDQRLKLQKENKVKILVTAGSTRVPVDKVRAVTNIFKGKTGTQIAEWFVRFSENSRNNDVTLITSREELIHLAYRDKDSGSPHHTRDGLPDNLKVYSYNTFEQLKDIMGSLITTCHFDLIIHSAAVSDYRIAEVFEEDENGTRIPIATDAKIASGKKTLVWKMVPTEKIVDKIKRDWKFTGKLVIFKLQIGMADKELVEATTKTMERCGADLAIANCLDWPWWRALLVDKAGKADEINRDTIAENLEKRLVAK